MRAFFLYLWVQLKMDIRERGTLLTFYLVPLVFYAVMGAVFSSINPLTRDTLTASMTIFAATMGAVLGLPVPIVKLKESGVLRAFRVSGIPGNAVLLVHAASAFLHLLVVSVIILLTAPLFFGALWPKNADTYFIVLLLLILASIALGLLIGVWARGQSAATMLSQAVFLPSLLLSGIMFPARMLPGSLAWAGRVFPATHAMQAFTGLAFDLKPVYNSSLALGMIVLIGFIATAAAAWRFNVIGKEA